MSKRFEPRRIGLAADLPRGAAVYIPRTDYSAGGGGEYGAEIADHLRTFAVTREPVAHRVVFTVAHDIFDNWFTLSLEGDEEGNKSKEFDKQVQTELQRLKAKRELTRMAIFERAYGWAILVLGYKDEGEHLATPLKKAVELQNIKAYGPTQMLRVDTVTNPSDDRYGLPNIYYIKKGSGVVTAMKVHHSRVIHFATRWVDTSKDEWKGQSVLDCIWDDLVTLRNVRWSMGQTMYRYGAGFANITFKNAELEDIEAWEDAGEFSNLSNRTYFAHTEDQEIDFIGTAGKAIDPEPYYKAIIENISCGSGIPEAILRGVQAGALTGSEVNQQEYYGVVSDEQSAYEQGIRQLIDIVVGLKLKKTLPETAKAKTDAEPPSFEIEWESGIELPEDRRTDIDLKKTQALQLKGQWHTRNELRRMEDPDSEPLPADQGGDEILGKTNLEEFEPRDTYHVKPLADGSSTVTSLKHRHRH